MGKSASSAARPHEMASHDGGEAPAENRGQRPSTTSGEVQGSGAGAGGGAETEDYDSDPQAGSGNANIRPQRTAPETGVDAPNHGSR